MSSNSATTGPRHPLLAAASRVSKAVLWVAGFGAAIATILGWWQLAVAAANPHADAYAALNRLGVAVTVDHVIAVLGEPAAVTRIEGIDGDGGSTTFADYQRQVFLQEDYIVTILSDAQGEVQQFTVLSCDPTFQPAFRTPVGSTVRLNDAPLGAADTSDAAAEMVYVTTDGTASTPVQMLDVMRASGDAPTRYRGYGLGISELCVPFRAPDGAGIEAHAGPIDGLSDAALLLRSTRPANYYVEIGMSYSLVADGVRFVLPPQESIPTGYLLDAFGEG